MDYTFEPMRGPRTYKEAITLLNSLQSNHAAIEAARALNISPAKRSELSLNEVREYTRRLGYLPQDFNLLNLIHVTGTKGKGSACAFTESILSQYRKTGHINKIGLFTSPHLKSVRERIRLNGAPITESKFTKYFYEVWDRLSETLSDPKLFPTLQPSDTVKPMYFKYLTVLSFHVFISEGVDTAIYEVGVGGRYDSTNIIEQPTVAAITSLGIDHTHMLGNTIESIAWNKAGIFKPNCPALVSEQCEYPHSLEIVEEVANETNVSSYDVVPESLIPGDLKLGLAGDFQKYNAAVAVKAAQTHLKFMRIADINVNDLPDEFIAGLASARWDGRCQKIKDSPNFEGISWFIDGAHTMESIDVASTWYVGASAAVEKPKILLFNQQSRENAKELLGKLYEVIILNSRVKFDHVIFTTNITWSDGSYNNDLVSMNNSKEEVDKMVIQKELASKWDTLDRQNGLSARKHIFPDIETSLRFIKSVAADNRESEVFVCGSLHLVGGFLTVLEGKRD